MYRRICILASVCAVLSVVAVLQGPARRAFADPVVKLHGEGMLASANAGPAEFVLVGQGSHLGEFTCFGEVDFVPGSETGSLVGTGVAVFFAANGDQLVASVLWEIAPDGEGVVLFPWEDAVTFSNGDTYESTGRFVDNRPAGALIGHGGFDSSGTFSYAQIGHGG